MTTRDDNKGASQDLCRPVVSRSCLFYASRYYGCSALREKSFRKGVEFLALASHRPRQSLPSSPKQHIKGINSLTWSERAGFRFCPPFPLRQKAASWETTYGHHQQSRRTEETQSNPDSKAEEGMHVLLLSRALCLSVSLSLHTYVTNHSQPTGPVPIYFFGAQKKEGKSVSGFVRATPRTTLQQATHKYTCVVSQCGT